jgi:small conductance mechanosensitive channel
MMFIQVLKNKRILSAFIVWAILLIAFSGASAESDKKSEPTPLTTKNPNISKEELGYLVEPLTKDDLSVEANGWLQVLKKHVGALSKVQIKALTAEGDQKTQLLETANKLKEEQTALTDRLKLVIEELKLKGGEVKDYESYVNAISGVEVDVSDASAAWTVITGWLTSAEGGIRWAKNLLFFLVIILISWILSKIVGKAVEKAVANIKSASALLKEFITNISRKAIFIVGFFVALSMLEVNTNITGTSKRRVDFVFGIGYSDDIAKA